jgi:hypothetical protein
LVANRSADGYHDLMNDPSHEEGLLDPARRALFEALNGLETTLYNMGYDAGFNAGWDAAVRRFTAVIEQRPEPDAAPTVRPQPAKIGDRIDADLPAKERVLQLIQLSPGLRGVELVEALNKDGATMPERTVRTALHRLKNSGQVRNEDGKWYAVTDQEPTLGELLNPHNHGGEPRQ